MLQQRSLVALGAALGLAFALAACELQPPPKQAPPPAGSAAGSAAVVPPPPAPAPAPSRPAPPRPTPSTPPPAPAKIAITPPCLEIGVHVADVIIGEAKGAAKQQLAQQRTMIVRRTGEGCSQQHWSPAVMACFRRAKSVAALRACDRIITPPAAPPGARPSEATGAPAKPSRGHTRVVPRHVRPQPH